MQRLIKDPNSLTAQSPSLLDFTQAGGTLTLTFVQSHPRTHCDTGTLVFHR
jgi:hypothetical protein